ncbi:MAG TPA: GlsB/YeaQ/YmgE family stress response membrane protein [Vitreimonas sp.]|nr:GlsB/YeaQ/YmgE family stress response membrane protein [Vitreimonas sp.]
MGLLTWIVLGLVAGAIASFLVGGGFGIIGTIILGIIGAVVGGFLASAMGVGSVDGFDLGSIVIATIGAIIVIFIARAVSGRRSTTV